MESTEADSEIEKEHLLEHSSSIEGMSPHYAAPEQFDSDEYGGGDHATDIYQLGTVFYELFTVRPPFEMMRKVERKELTPLSAIADVPGGLNEVLLTALATEKDDRYERAVSLWDLFEQ